MTIRELPPLLKEKSIKELNENPAILHDEIQAIKDWLSKQSHIKARSDDQWLLAFIRGCKHSLDKTKDKLDTFYTMKSIIPDIAVCKNPMEPDIQKLLSLGIFLPLKSEKPDDPRIILLRPGLYDPKQVPMLKVMCLYQMFLCLQLLDDDQSVVAGQLYVIDWTNIGSAHFTQATIIQIKKLIIYLQKGLPVRGKGSHHIHHSPGINTLFSLIKMIINEKARRRLQLHGDDESSLHSLIPKSTLPKEYGGNGDNIQDLIDYWKTKMENNKDWFIEDKLFKTDESKRIGTPQNDESLFGIEGSFKQLDID